MEGEGEDGIRMKKISMTAQYGNGGVAESSRTLKGGQPDIVPPGQRGKSGEAAGKGPGLGPSEAIPTAGNGSKSIRKRSQIGRAHV